MAGSSEETEETQVEEPLQRGEGRCRVLKDTIWADGSNTEVQAFYFNSFGKSTLFISASFLSLAIFDLANKQAGCPQLANGAYAPCGNRVYGAKPSSMLPLMGVIGNVVTAMFMPYAGAVVDYTPRRREFGIAVSSILVLSNFVQIFLFESTWFALAIIQAAFATSSFYACTMVLWSYVKDMADSDHALHGITACGRLWDTTAMFSFLLLVTLVGVVSGWSSVSLAQFSQAVASAVGGAFLWLAYSRFGPRPAQRELPVGKSLYRAGWSSIVFGIIELGKTSPGAKRYLITILFAGGAITSFTTIGITYLRQLARMTNFQTQVFLIIALILGIPGALLHRTVARRFGHKKGYIACLSFWILITVLFVLILDGPGKVGIGYLFGALYGVGFGWYYPSSHAFFISLLPEGRDVELWGWQVFASVAISWVPPLIFTGLNEAANDLRLGMVGIIGFHFIGLLLGCTIDDNKHMVKTEEADLGEIEAGENIQRGDEMESGEEGFSDNDLR